MPKSKQCVILQPTFLPWLGWFDLVDQSDVMVVLDDVAFSKQSWQQRNRIRTRNGLEFLSVPVKTAGRLGQKILACELVDQLFVPKMLMSLRTSYAKAPFFESAFTEISVALYDGASSGKLLELNCSLIRWIAQKLDVTTPMVRASELGAGGDRGEHVAAICEGVGALSYLSPAGAEEYLVEDKVAFDRRGITVQIHVYEHPQYVQRFQPFIPYASAVDLIFNLGPAAAAVMRSGRRPPRSVGTR
jgi:hypothetical protein